MTYEGREFTLTACRDSSQVEIYNPPRPRAPWPYPETNLLADWHFTNEDLSPWRIDGSAITARLMNSTTPLDILHARTGAGIRYLRIVCADVASDCGGSLYQDLALKGLPVAGSFDSVFRSSSTFLTTSAAFRVKPGAVALRLTLSPKMPREYDILDTWVMPR
jgi:hypothetical protein